MAQRKTASKVKKGSPDIISTKVTELSEEEIARRAYMLWETRGRPFGSPEEDWHKATEQLREGL